MILQPSMVTTDNGPAIRDIVRNISQIVLTTAITKVQSGKKDVKILLSSYEFKMFIESINDTVPPGTPHFDDDKEFTFLVADELIVVKPSLIKDKNLHRVICELVN